jgi:hypothetical protein
LGQEKNLAEVRSGRYKGDKESMMNRFRLIVFVLLATSFCLAQDASPATPAASSSGQDASSQASAAASANAIKGAFPTSLAKSLDSKKLKDGDTVVCTTVSALHSGNGMMIPSGSKVIGHVTQAQARSKGDSDSSLAMVFDKIQVSGGKIIPMKGVLQAVGPSLGGNSGPDTGAAGGGTMPGHGGESTMPPPTQGSVAGPNSGVHNVDATGPRAMLNSQSVGVLGIKNLQMDKDSVLTTTGKEVKLDNGTQMLIRAEIEIPVQ